MTSTITGTISQRGPPSRPAAISPKPAKIESAAIATPPPSAAIRPTPVAAPSAATSTSSTSVARAIMRAGSSPREPPKARYRPTPIAVRATMTNRPGPSRKEGGEKVVTARIASSAATTIVVVRERPAAHARSPSSVGKNASSAR